MALPSSVTPSAVLDAAEVYLEKGENRGLGRFFCKHFGLCDTYLVQLRDTEAFEYVLGVTVEEECETE